MLVIKLMTLHMGVKHSPLSYTPPILPTFVFQVLELQSSAVRTGFSQGFATPFPMWLSPLGSSLKFSEGMHSKPLFYLNPQCSKSLIYL